MILLIDTSDREYIILKISNHQNSLVKRKKILAAKKQSEKLLPNIEKMLVSLSLRPTDLSKIQVVARGNSFTSLRIGVIVANALSYALNIPIEAIEVDGQKIIDDIDKQFKQQLVVSPRYNREPNIGIKKNQ